MKWSFTYCTLCTTTYDGGNYVSTNTWAITKGSYESQTSYKTRN